MPFYKEKKRRKQNKLSIFSYAAVALDSKSILRCSAEHFSIVSARLHKNLHFDKKNTLPLLNVCDAITI